MPFPFETACFFGVVQFRMSDRTSFCLLDICLYLLTTPSGSYSLFTPLLIQYSLVAAVACNERLERKPFRALNEQQFLLVCCVPSGTEEYQEVGVGFVKGFKYNILCKSKNQR